MDRKIYVGNLDRDTTKEEVETLFAKFGELDSCWIARNPAGFAFVTYKEADKANDAVREMNGADFKGQALKVEVSRSDGRRRRDDRPRDHGRRDGYDRPRDDYHRGGSRYEDDRNRGRDEGRRDDYRRDDYRRDDYRRDDYRRDDYRREEFRRDDDFRRDDYRREARRSRSPGARY